MSEMMTFPDTWEDFEKSYGFTDSEEVYTNGARLIPSFRVKQWLDHLLSEEPQKWIPVSEKLPEVGQNVLLSIGKGMFTAEGCLREDGDWCQFRWSTIWADYYVDAWMLLPEPWGGDKDETN